MKYAFIPAALAALCASAEEATTNLVANLGSVTVTARPITQEETISAEGAETVVLSRAQLGVLNAQDLQTALRQVPGITISRYAPVGSYGGAQGGSVYIRGAGTARPGGEIRMYTDGIPRESGVWGHPLMDSVPVDFADRITVLKNPHPGAAAGTFGAIDVETRRRREEGHEAESDLAYGRHGTFLSALSAGMKEGFADAYGGVSYRQSQGLRSHNDSRLTSAFGRFGLDLSEYEYLGFTYQHTDSRVEDPGEKHGPTPHRDAFNLASDVYGLRFETTRETLKGFSLIYFEHGDIAWHKDHLTDGNLASPAGYADTTWLNWGTRNRYDWNAWAGLWLTGAIDVADEGGHTKNTRESDNRRVFGYKGRFVTVSPYLGARYEFQLGDDWLLTPSAGARYYFHSHYDDEAAPCAALKLGWRDTVEFAVTGSRGVHYPGIYTRAVANDFAKNTLDAEKMDYVAGSAKVKIDESADITVTIFHSDVQNRIDRTATGYVNAGGQRATGVETSAHWSPCDALSFFGGATFTAPETHPAARLPRWTFTAGGIWKICKYLEAALDGQYIGSMYAYSVRAAPTAGDLRRLDDAFVFNARLALPLKSLSPSLDGGEIYVSLENLLSENYEYYPGYPMGGTMWYLGCRLRF